jgi:3-carboxy-cis,cis-muconate cycloisomerase
VVGVAARLGLDAPELPWHTERSRVTELAGALGVAAAACAKPARDVTLLAQGEVGEVSEDAPGGSSAMAHKRNPVAAVSTLAAALRAPGLVATLLTAAVQEHQRAAGGWQAEWRALCDLLVVTGSAAAWTRACLSGLHVHPDAMRANLDRAGAPAETGAGGPLGSAGAFVDAALARHAKESG